MKAKILLIDDTEVVVRGWQTVIESAGHSVKTATSGREAVEIAQAEKFDIVFTDLVMPGMDGVDVCKKIKAMSPETEIILISGYPEEIQKYQIDFVKAGGREEFLRKPLWEEDILKAVSSVLRRLKHKRYNKK